jgi:hypothetical protein
VTFRITKHEWDVTLLDRGIEITIRVEASSKQGARNEAHIWHPSGHIIHVEMVPGSGTAALREGAKPEKEGTYWTDIADRAYSEMREAEREDD